MEEETILLRVDDVQKALQISEQKAYDVIRTLNEELNAKGYITIRGRVNREYFMKRFQYSE
ncbi:MAG: hypothetical protein E7264_09335 [Lachnospiraceae bacterium]|nr:hypothetical protein [Lachnospiraceae bacterium]